MKLAWRPPRGSDSLDRQGNVVDSGKGKRRGSVILPEGSQETDKIGQPIRSIKGPGNGCGCPRVPVSTVVDARKEPRRGDMETRDGGASEEGGTRRGEGEDGQPSSLSCIYFNLAQLLFRSWFEFAAQRGVREQFLVRRYASKTWLLSSRKTITRQKHQRT